MYAVIRVRGPSAVKDRIEHTMEMLNLTRANHCVVVPEDLTRKGMLQEATGFITWGEVDKETLLALVEKRGRLPGDKKIPKEKAKDFVSKFEKSGMKGSGLKPLFRLNPPSKGFKATRLGYPKGDLGYRGGKINELLKRMI